MRTIGDARGVAAIVFCVATLALAHWPSSGGAQERAQVARAHVGCGAAQRSQVPGARIEVLRRGFNLTGWLDQRPPRRPDITTLANLRSRGFTHIRLPIKPELLMLHFSPPDTVEQQFDELDAAIDNLRSLNFAVSLDMHPGTEVERLQTTDRARAFELLEALWRTVARRYEKHSPDWLFFEVLNEPAVDARTWSVHGPRLAAAIRNAAPRHTVIYGPADYQTIEALRALVPLDDLNVVYAVHFYQPMVFTHQGLDWSSPTDALKFVEFLPFPAELSDPLIRLQARRLMSHGRADVAALIQKELAKPWTEDRVTDLIGQAAEWAVRHRRPVIVNEFGVLAWKSNPPDRARWIRAVRRAAERFCLGWTHWEYADGFGFIRRHDSREEIDESISEALLAAD